MKPRTLLILGLGFSFLVLVGWKNTPRGSGNTPLLLLPDLRAAQAYQRQVLRWQEKLLAIDGQLSVLFASTQQDLMQSSREAEKIQRNLLRLYQEVDQKDPPPSLAGVHDMLIQTTSAYLETARLGLNWVSSGGKEELTLARSQLAEAHTLFLDFSSSPWIRGQ